MIKAQVNNYVCEFSEEKLYDVTNNCEVMMLWEQPIMKRCADIVCHNRGDVLEIGFGMGICSTEIQKHSPKSHTIVENHPQVLAELKKWATNKNVIIIEGDWFKVKDKFTKYDGMFIDTYNDKNYLKFGDLAPKLAKTGCKFTFWNDMPKRDNQFNLNAVYDKVYVTPPENKYYNYSIYYVPTVVF